MAGIYLHIPFCRRKCHYCNFFSLASQKLKAPFLQALKQEIALTRDYLGGERIETIYFGGGTPSLIEPGELQEVMSLWTSPPDPFAMGLASPPAPSPGGEGGMVQQDSCNLPVEITLELNPEDVTEEYVAGLKKSWFNRFSLGVQSFSDADLTYLNRTHSAEQSVRAVKLLQDAGFENISIDLIYGIPTSEAAQWAKNLDTAFSLGVPHISAYALTVELRTPLAWMIEKERSAPVSDETQLEQFALLVEKTREKGFLQYEISNFCKPGHHAVHNTNYWKGVPYLGLGPSAHSYNGSSRRWNVSSLSRYIEAMGKGEPDFEEELLTATQKYNEYVMTSLRTMWGCDSGKIRQDFGWEMYDHFRKSALPFLAKGLLNESSGVFFLTEKGRFFADGITSELMFVT